MRKKDILIVLLFVLLFVVTFARVSGRGRSSLVLQSETPEIKYGVRLSEDRNTASVFIVSKLKKPIVLDGYRHSFVIVIESSNGEKVEIPNMQTIDVVGPGDNDWVILGAYAGYYCDLDAKGLRIPHGGKISLKSLQRDYDGTTPYFTDKGCQKVRLAEITSWSL